MTCREKLKIDHPELVNDRYAGGCSGCPNNYGYLERPDYCPYNEGSIVSCYSKCAECWDREIDELNTEETATRDDRKTIIDIITNAMKTKDMRIDLYFGDSGITCNIYPYNKD